jgi:hypothetical protein
VDARPFPRAIRLSFIFHSKISLPFRLGQNRWHQILSWVIYVSFLSMLLSLFAPDNHPLHAPSLAFHFPSPHIRTLYLSCPPSIPAAANHALSDCHAMNARPRTALAQAVVPLAASEKLTEGLLLQLLAGAVQVRRSIGNKRAGKWME